MDGMGITAENSHLGISNAQASAVLRPCHASQRATIHNLIGNTWGAGTVVA